MHVDPTLDQLDLGDHVCCSVADPGRLRAVAASGVVSGLRDGQRLLFFVDDPDELKRYLAAEVAGATEALERHQLEIHAGGGAYLSEKGFDVEQMLDVVSGEVEITGRRGYPGLRAFGELTGFLHNRDNAEAIIEYETRLNPIYARGGLIGVCLYDPRTVPPEVWRRICAVHPTTVLRTTSEPVTRLHGRRTPRGIRLTGEADLMNQAALPGLLSEIISHPDACHIDATALRFADARAVGWLLRAATARGGRPTTITCGAGLAESLRLCGALTVPGLVVTTAETS